MIGFADASAPCQDECEDQELSSYYKVDLLVDMMELTGEKADDDVQYRTGNVYETNACKWNEIILQITYYNL